MRSLTRTICRDNLFHNGRLEPLQCGDVSIYHPIFGGTGLRVITHMTRYISWVFNSDLIGQTIQGTSSRGMERKVMSCAGSARGRGRLRGRQSTTRERKVVTLSKVGLLDFLICLRSIFEIEMFFLGFLGFQLRSYIFNDTFLLIGIGQRRRGPYCGNRGCGYGRVFVVRRKGRGLRRFARGPVGQLGGTNSLHYRLLDGLRHKLGWWVGRLISSLWW